MQKCFFEWKTQKFVRLIAVQLFQMNFRQSVKLIIWPMNNIHIHRRIIHESIVSIFIVFLQGSIKLEAKSGLRERQTKNQPINAIETSYETSIISSIELKYLEAN